LITLDQSVTLCIINLNRLLQFFVFAQERLLQFFLKLLLRIDLRIQYTLYDEISLRSDLHSTCVSGYDDKKTLTICDPQICYELECVIDEEIMIFALKSGFWLKSIS